MADLLISIFTFIAGIYLLSKAADSFVDKAGSLGKSYGMSRIMIGLTIVAIGTSLPEMITSLGSIMFTDNFSQFIIGTTLGSNVTNILLAFGIFLVITEKFYIKKDERFNIIALLGTTLILTGMILIGYINYFAISLLIFYTYYLIYQLKYQKVELIQIQTELTDLEKIKPTKAYLHLAAAFIGLYIGARLTVLSVEEIGLILAIPAAHLSLVVISIATSLPEIMVTFASARKKEYLLAIGNVIGTNIMNICIIIGASGFYGHYFIDTKLYITSLTALVLGTIIFSYLIYRKRFNKKWGYLFLTMYALYIIAILLQQ